METKALYEGILKYFDIRELVSPGVYNKYYQRYGVNFILSRFDKRLLETILWIRETIDSPITANDWLWNGRFDERGLRDTSTPMVQDRAARDDAWISGHVMAMALDYTVEGQTAAEHRDWLEARAEALPHKIRLENEMDGQQISWVHLDVCDEPDNPKVYRFNI